MSLSNPPSLSLTAMSSLLRYFPLRKNVDGSLSDIASASGKVQDPADENNATKEYAPTVEEVSSVEPLEPTNTVDPDLNPGNLTLEEGMFYTVSLSLISVPL